MKDTKTSGFATRAIHAGQKPDAITGAVMTPIYQTSTYVQSSPGEHKGYEYSRTDNPTRHAYEECLASLENGKHGIAFASGMAAIDAILHLVKPGDHIVSCDDVYGGTYRILTKIFEPLGVQVTFTDLGDVNNLEKAIQPNTKMIWMESPTNPLLKILDIQKLCAIAKSKNLISVVDNTFMSPYFQNPLNLGADIVVHSVTKFVNGHSDVVGGIVVTNSDETNERLRFFQNSIGAVPGPQDCFLVMRGIKTLAVRMKQHEQNGKAVATFLENHPQVERVIYPGLESHPQHQIAKEQMSGFGGMVTFLLKGGLTESRKFLENVKLFSLAESLGGVESLIEHPAIMTHASIPKEVREELGILDNLVRISVGIEDEADLIADLKQALGNLI